MSMVSHWLSLVIVTCGSESNSSLVYGMIDIRVSAHCIVSGIISPSEVIIHWFPYTLTDFSSTMLLLYSSYGDKFII